MSVRAARRTAIDYWLRAARLPLDAATHVLPAGRETRTNVVLGVDRADAAIRVTVGRLLDDDEIVADAHRRRIAAEERGRALVLRREADERQAAADSQLSRELEAAARLRDEGERNAQQRRDAADRERARREQHTRDQAEAQERAVDATHRKTRAAETKAAKRARLELLEKQAAALDQEADALTARDEAQRLRDAAGSAKSARKS
jgi:hypothetical protein